MKLLKKCAPKLGAVVLTLAVAASMMCCVAFAADTDAEGDTGATTNAVVTVVDSDGNVLSENEVVVDDASSAEVEVVEDVETESAEITETEAETEEAETEAETDEIEETNSSSRRFYIIGGIILAVGIAFYVFLSIKTRKK